MHDTPSFGRILWIVVKVLVALAIVLILLMAGILLIDQHLWSFTD